MFRKPSFSKLPRTRWLTPVSARWQLQGASVNQPDVTYKDRFLSRSTPGSATSRSRFRRTFPMKRWPGTGRCRWMIALSPSHDPSVSKPDSLVRPPRGPFRLSPDQNRPGGDLQVSQDPHHWGFVAYQIGPRGCCGTSARSNGTALARERANLKETSFSTASTSSIAPGSVSNRSLCCIFTAIWSVPQVLQQ